MHFFRDLEKPTFYYLALISYFYFSVIESWLELREKIVIVEKEIS